MNDRQAVMELITAARILNASGFDVGDFIMQKASNKENDTYAVVIGNLINGANQVITIQEWRGLAAMKSTKGWYPAPVKINRADVPAKLLVKLEKKMGNMNL